MHNMRNVGGRLLTPAWAQFWQPTLTSHDPNPPLTLESPAAAPAVTASIGRGLVTSILVARRSFV